MRSIWCLSVTRQMSKAKKGERKPVETKETGPVSVNKDGSVIIQILAKPGAKSNNITDVSEEGVGVQIASKPVDGEANSELLKYMSGVLGLKKNEISLDKGSKSRQKILLINKQGCTVENIIAKLKEEIGK